MDFLQRSTFYRVRVDHRRPNIAVTQQFLNRADVIVGLQEMGGKREARGLLGFDLRQRLVSKRPGLQ